MCVENTGGNVTEAVEFARPSIADVHRVLREHRALLVHFSGTPPMTTSGLDPREYPDDLTNVAGGFCNSGVSSSTVMPGDKFGAVDGSNAAGCVGLILRPASDRSILAAENHDIGSQFENGRRVYGRKYTEKDIDAESLAATISTRSPSGYNEWGVHEFMVIGILAMEPLEVNWAGASTKTTASAIAELFPDLPLYRFAEDGLVRLHGDMWVVAEHGDLYP